MRPYQALAAVVLIAGIALVAYGIYIGEASVGIFLIFPFVMGTGAFSAVGILLIIGAMLVYVYDALKAHGFEGGSWEVVGLGGGDEGGDEDARGRGAGTTRGGRGSAKKGGGGFKGGGVVFLGPIPIVFGSNRKWAEYMMILGILLVVALCAMFFVMAL